MQYSFLFSQACHYQSLKDIKMCLCYVFLQHILVGILINISIILLYTWWLFYSSIVNQASCSISKCQIFLIPFPIHKIVPWLILSRFSIIRHFIVYKTSFIRKLLVSHFIHIRYWILIWHRFLIILVPFMKRSLLF